MRLLASDPGREVEIVAVRIGSVITNAPQAVRDAAWLSGDMEYLDRRRMAFMAAMDLGPQWERLAAGPTLFTIPAAVYYGED